MANLQLACMEPGKYPYTKKYYDHPADIAQRHFYMDWKSNVITGKEFGDLDDIVSYFRRIFLEPWWVQFDTPDEFHVEVRGLDKERQTAYCNSEQGSHTHEMSFPRWAKNEVLVLHELAHAIHASTGEWDAPQHGTEWIRIFLKLIYHALGPDQYKRMHDLFLAFNVQVI